MSIPPPAALALLAASLLAAGCSGAGPEPARPPDGAGDSGKRPPREEPAPAPSPSPAPRPEPPPPKPPETLADGCTVLLQQPCEDAPCSCVVAATSRDAGVLARVSGLGTRYVPALLTAGSVRLGDRSIDIITKDTSMCKTAKNKVSGVSVVRDERGLAMEIAVAFDVYSNCPETGVPPGKPMSKGNHRKEALRCTPVNATLSCEVTEPSP